MSIMSWGRREYRSSLDTKLRALSTSAMTALVVTVFRANHSPNLLHSRAASCSSPARSSRSVRCEIEQSLAAGSPSAAVDGPYGLVANVLCRLGAVRPPPPLLLRRFGNSGHRASSDSFDDLESVRPSAFYIQDLRNGSQRAIQTSRPTVSVVGAG